jgi:hypothetical protein
MDFSQRVLLAVDDVGNLFLDHIQFDNILPNVIGRLARAAPEDPIHQV